MPIFHAIVLGIVQGLTEFLPISSSGHLLLVPWLFDWNDFAGSGGKSVEKAFDVALHIGTLIAVVAYFWRDLIVYARDGLRMIFKRREPATPEGRLAWLLVLSSVPAFLIGGLFGDTIDEKLGTIPLIAVSLIVFGLLLGFADQRSKRIRPVDSFTRKDALIVGAAQVLALNPGTSRSGITITANRFLTFTRDSAARISFLMAIPVTAGAIVFKMAKLVGDGIPDGLLGPMIVGIITSGLLGWVAVWGTIKYVRHHSYTPFVIYRVALGLAGAGHLLGALTAHGRRCGHGPRGGSPLTATTTVPSTRPPATAGSSSAVTATTTARSRTATTDAPRATTCAGQRAPRGHEVDLVAHGDRWWRVPDRDGRRPVDRAPTRPRPDRPATRPSRLRTTGSPATTGAATTTPSSSDDSAPDGTSAAGHDWRRTSPGSTRWPAGRSRTATTTERAVPQRCRASSAPAARE